MNEMVSRKRFGVNGWQDNWTMIENIGFSKCFGECWRRRRHFDLILRAEVVVGKAAATLKDGVLELTMPKAAPAKKVVPMASNVA